MKISLYDYLEEVSKLINKFINKKMCVLVHCRGGIHRSPTMILAYLIKYLKKTLEEVLIIIQNARPCAKPRSN